MRDRKTEFLSLSLQYFDHISPKQALKYTIFFNIKKVKKWLNGKIILYLANHFKKVQIWMIWPIKRPTGNHDKPKNPLQNWEKRFE